MLELGIDEITLVLKPVVLAQEGITIDSNIMVEWQAKAEYSILIFEDTANLVNCFGEKQGMAVHK